VKFHDQDEISAFIDAVLGDLSARHLMYVGRRAQDGDADSCVIQTGEDGRYRLALPDLGSSRSIGRFTCEIQAHLTEILGAPVPRCPQHDHALAGRALEGRFVWECPEGGWRCGLGDYEERTWPQLDAGDKLAPILSRRLHRRGIAFRSLGVNRTDDGIVAEVGLPEPTGELIDRIREAAAPLRAAFHQDSSQPIRVYAPSDK
jgi:hypothetical protein